MTDRVLSRGRRLAGRSGALALAVFGGLSGLAISAGSATAEVNFCNETKVRRSVAIGFKGASDWESSGWWNIEPGACGKVYDGPVRNRYFYYRAIDPKGQFQGENYLFCTQPKKFDITGQKDCVARGYRLDDFAKVDIKTPGEDLTVKISGPDARVTAEPGTPQVPAKVPEPFGKPKPDSAAKGPVAKPKEPEAFSIPDPGAYGQPTTITGIFKGCEPVEGKTACTVVADSWKYVATDDGRSPPDLFEQMAKLPLNSGVTLSGDLGIEGDTSIDITLRSVEPEEDALDAPRGQLYNSLVGAWRSTEDPRSTIRFVEDGRKFDYYDGNAVAEGQFKVGVDCGGVPSTVEQPLVTVRSNSDPAVSCYGLLSVTKEALSLIHLPRGNRLDYVRDAN